MSISRIIITFETYKFTVQTYGTLLQIYKIFINKKLTLIYNKWVSIINSYAKDNIYENKI